MHALLHPLLSLTRLGQWVDPVDGNRQFAGEDQPHGVFELQLAAHGRADDADLAAEHDVDGRLSGVAGGAADCQQPAALLQAAHAGFPRGRADVINHHIHASLAAVQIGSFGPVGLGLAIDDPVRAQLRCLLCLGRATGHNPDRRAQHFGQGDRETVDAAARAHQQDRLARLELAARDQHAPGGDGHCRCGCGLFHRETVGHGHQVARRHLDELSEAAADVLAQDRKGVAQTLLAGQAERAVTAPKRWVGGHRLPRDPVGDILAQRDDGATEVGARNVRQQQVQSFPAAHYELVQPIQRSITNFDQGFVGSKFRNGKVLDIIQCIEGTMFAEEDCLHKTSMGKQLRR